MTSVFGPPIDLTDLPSFHVPELRARRSVFVGRVSTKDNQNPETSIPRQVHHASQRLEAGEKFVAYFWDVESGMLPPELRGLGPQELYDELDVRVPRDGGLQDLVDRAEHMGITHVLAERSDRLARAMLTSLTVEHALAGVGVEVVYANEPTGGTESGRLRSRRYGQVEAEIYRTIMLENSMGGQVQHAINGWNHGYPPYPYTAVIDPDAPRVQSNRFGEPRRKRKLVPHPDPRRFDAAREICRLRREEHRKAADIIAILEAAPDRYPIEHHWTHNLVEGLIANPKLTGHQVYNRKASRTGRPGCSKLNPISMWVWSPHVVHEPVISLAEWKQAQQVTAALKAGVRGDGPLQLIRAAAGRLRLPVTAIRSSDTHTLYQIGDRQIALPTPIPYPLACQLIDDLQQTPPDEPSRPDSNATIECQATRRDTLWIARDAHRRLYGHGKALKSARDAIIEGLAFLGLNADVNIVATGPQMQQLRAIEDAYTTALRDAVTVLARQRATVQDIATATGISTTRVKQALANQQ
ncbi:recombinase family protein [Actinocatenispora comari]|nr:recombinase family protein [Actinocatenispora comari]